MKFDSLDHLMNKMGCCVCTNVTELFKERSLHPIFLFVCLFIYLSLGHVTTVQHGEPDFNNNIDVLEIEKVPSLNLAKSYPS